MAVLVRHDYGQRTGRPEASDIPTLPSIRQAVPQILEAVPPNHENSNHSQQLPTPPRSLTSLYSNSVSSSPTQPGSLEDSSSNSPGRSSTSSAYAWEGSSRDKRLGDSSLQPVRSVSNYEASSSGPDGRSSHSGYRSVNGYSGPSSDAGYRSDYRSQQSFPSDSGSGRRPTSYSGKSYESSSNRSSLYDVQPRIPPGSSFSGRNGSEPLSPLYPPSPYDSPESGRLPSYTSAGNAPYIDQNKRRRGNLPKPVTDLLRKWFHDHLMHPYPSEDEKQFLMQQTGLSMAQISNWFINARRRQPKPQDS